MLDFYVCLLWPYLVQIGVYLKREFIFRKKFSQNRNEEREDKGE
jgi:hypothetical protein